jgi:hypothetical protein
LFISWREDEMLKRLKKNIGIKDNEIDYPTIWENDEEE